MKKRQITALLTAAVLTGSMMTGCAQQAQYGTNTVSAAETSGNAAGEADTSDTGSSGATAETTTANAAAETVEQSASVTEAAGLDLTTMFTDRDSDPSYDEAAAERIVLSDASGENEYTIVSGGVYVVSGETSDGQIVVDAGDTDKVQIVLNGVTMTNDDSACIFVKNADKVFVTLAEGTTNTLNDTEAEYVQTDDGSTVDGVVFSRDDICFQGSGTLIVNASNHHAIVGKDDLKVTGGTYRLTASGKGIQANDSIRILDGTFDIDSTDDGLHTDTADTEGKGYLYIAGGTLTIASGDDAVHAETALVVTGGTVDVTQSVEGLEGATIDILGGDIKVKSDDDGLNASGTAASTTTVAENAAATTTATVTENAGTSTGTTAGESAAANGQQPAEMPKMANGQQPPEMPQMADGQQPAGMPQDGSFDPSRMNRGERPLRPDMAVTSGSNGQITGEQGFQGMGGRGFGGGMRGGDMLDADETAYIRISGGTVYVDAGGDGIDSNGYFYMEGGNVIVDGPVNDGNGAVDVAISAVVSGGSFAASGSAGMAQGFSGESSQGHISAVFSENISGGTGFSVTDANGNVLYSAVPAKDYRSVIISSPSFEAGTYTVTAGSASVEVTVK